jgi:hypothetical protein
MSETSGKIKIDRLALNLPGFDAEAASRLASLVASHLAQAGQASGDVAIPRLEIVLSAPDTDLDRLAWRISSAILQAG